MVKFSILTNDLETCMMHNNSSTCSGRIERHHVMNGSDRDKSTKYGLIAPLCIGHHTMLPDAVHRSRYSADQIRAKAHIAFEHEYPDLNWLNIFGRNYKHLLEEQEDGKT